MGNFLQHIFNYVTSLLEILPLTFGIKSKFFSMEQFHPLALPTSPPYVSVLHVPYPRHHCHHIHLHHQTSCQVLGMALC